MSKSNFYNFCACVLYVLAILFTVGVLLHFACDWDGKAQTQEPTAKLYLAPTAIDGDGDARDDFWRVGNNLGNAHALFVPSVLIPESWLRVGSAKWVSNNNGGAVEVETFSRTFTLPAQGVDMLSIEVGFEFSASAETQLYINGQFLKSFDLKPNMRMFYQAKGQTIYRAGENRIEFKVKAASNGSLLGFMFHQGYVNYDAPGQPRSRTLQDYRRKGGRTYGNSR